MSQSVINHPRGIVLQPAGRPEWQLPEGVPRGVWEYAAAAHIADQYDEYFAENRLFEFDEQVLARHFARPGLVVDLGCGTGRALVTLARRGFRGVGVDLSPAMLRIVAEKARAEPWMLWSVDGGREAAIKWRVKTVPINLRT